MNENSLAGTDTSSLLDILQPLFGPSYLSDFSDEGGDASTEEGSEKEETTDKVPAGKMKEMSTLASAEWFSPLNPSLWLLLAFPKIIYLFMAPKLNLTTIAQVPPCNPDFAQKAVT